MSPDLRQTFDVTGFAPGTVTLESAAGPSGGLIAATGTPVAKVGDADAYLDPAIGPPNSAQHRLVWAVGATTISLVYPSTTPLSQAVDLANRLAPLDQQQWQSLLEPTSIRPDLVRPATSEFAWFDSTGDGQTTTTG